MTLVLYNIRSNNLVWGFPCLYYKFRARYARTTYAAITKCGAFHVHNVKFGYVMLVQHMVTASLCGACSSSPQLSNDHCVSYTYFS